VNSFVLVYVHANEFFLKINYPINIKDFNNSNYSIEELVYQKHNTIMGNIYTRYENVTHNPSTYVGDISEVLNIHTIININKTTEL